MNETKIVKETKNKIKVDFERTSALERFKIKYLRGTFVVNLIWYIFRFVLLLGISYVILYPFFTKISSSFMSPQDLVDTTVKLIPKYPTLDRYIDIIVKNHYFKAMFNTLIVSAVTAVLQTFVCCFVAYGFAKYKFKGNGILFAIVIFTMIVPHNTLRFAMYMRFRYFDIFGIFKLIMGKSPTLINTFIPLIMLSLTGLAYRNGLYIFMLRQFFKGIPDELEESAYIDGSGVFRTFFTIILPISIPMMITVFLFAFSWQWTDYFYSGVFFTNTKILTLSNFMTGQLTASSAEGGATNAAASLLIIAPLIILYLFGQRYLVTGIERSGLTAD